MREDGAAEAIYERAEERWFQEHGAELRQRYEALRDEECMLWEKLRNCRSKRDQLQEHDCPHIHMKNEGTITLCPDCGRIW